EALSTHITAAHIVHAHRRVTEATGPTGVAGAAGIDAVVRVGQVYVGVGSGNHETGAIGLPVNQAVDHGIGFLGLGTALQLNATSGGHAVVKVKRTVGLQVDGTGDTGIAQGGGG